MPRLAAEMSRSSYSHLKRRWFKSAMLASLNMSVGNFSWLSSSTASAESLSCLVFSIHTKPGGIKWNLILVPSTVANLSKSAET